MLSKLRIAGKLAIGFAVALALMLVAVLGAVLQTGRINDHVTYYGVNLLPSYALLRQMTVALANERRMELRHLAALDSAEMSEVEAAREAHARELSEAIERYQKDLISDDAERALADKARASVQSYLAFWPSVQAASRKALTSAEQKSVADDLMNLDSLKLYGDASAVMDEWFAYKVKLGEEQRREAAEGFSTALRISGALALLGVCISVGAAILITRSVTIPLDRALEAARTVARGDLTIDVDASGHDETATLLRTLGEMIRQLRTTVGQVRASSDSIATGSSQIATGNADLSQRTEQQASALQETAATMDQIGSTVRHNAENAQQADQLAQGAAGVAARGGEVVGRVVSTMEGISESSRKIGDIIGVIDGIAFQTNILALNAAVEAARAGEQGRGFAVVAGEVRSLAQRSAEAAKEIKGLIQRNVDQVEQGTTLVGEAGHTMDEILAAVRRVSSLVSEISTATVEQSSGIGQVGDAVSQMDQVTQQNAALVEESAAAAESLRLQAQQLLEAVSMFKLRQELGSTAHPTGSAQRPAQVATAARSPARRSQASQSDPAALNAVGDWCSH